MDRSKERNRRLFDRLAVLVVAVSLGHLSWFLASLDWQREGTFRVSAAIPPTWSSYLALLLPPSLLLLFLVLRRLVFGGPAQP